MNTKGIKVIIEHGFNNYYLDGRLHRENGPAVIDDNGDKKWYLNGMRYRKDGVSVSHLLGVRTYSLPAAEYDDGTKFWYINDKLHREDGPAVEFVHGDKEWYINGLLHREDGVSVSHLLGVRTYSLPAKEYVNGGKHYYLEGKLVNKADVMKNKDKSVSEDKEMAKEVAKNTTEGFHIITIELSPEMMTKDIVVKLVSGKNVSLTVE